MALTLYGGEDVGGGRVPDGEAPVAEADDQLPSLRPPRTDRVELLRLPTLLDSHPELHRFR